MIQFDCHAHVYETITVVDGARYRPSAVAPLQTWLNHQRDSGLKGGVIVQVSFLSTDNSQLCAALAQLNRSRFAGVAVVPLTVEEAELDALVAAGVRGLRWNLVRGAAVPDLNHPMTRAFLGKLRARGLHLEIHLEGPRLAPLLPQLADLGVDVVIDHFGLPSEATPDSDPMIRALSTLPDRGALFLKFAASYRTAFDLRPHADALLSLMGAEHVIWGSDWPHTQHEDRASYDAVWQEASGWGDLDDAAAVRRLYRLG